MPKAGKPIDFDFVAKCLRYDPETGVFVRLRRDNVSVQNNAKCAGKIAGARTIRGYISITIDGRIYLAHRLAFVLMTGSCPELVDHINRDGFDNRWGNLRAANSSQNSVNRLTPRNNTSGVVGVSWFKPAKLWQAEICRRGKKYHLGYFHQFEAAVSARLSAEQTLPDSEYLPRAA